MAAEVAAWQRAVLAGVGLAFVFATALSVRLAYRSDRAGDFDQIMPSQSFISHRRAIRMLEGGGILWWDDADPEQVRQIRRPPGYAAFLAGIYLVTGADLRRAQLVQIVIDALVAVAVALVGAALVSRATGGVAGMLYALSPHLAVFSTIVTPDAVASWPVFAGTVLFIAALRRSGRVAFGLAAVGGAAIGLSCWLTAQGFTLPIALLAAGVAVARSGVRRRAVGLGAVLLAGTLLVVAPLTIRNVAVYGALVPVRPGLGVTLVEGLGVYDPSLPATDGALLADEAARSGRPEYGKALYFPDGLERERERVRRAVDLIASRPLWFAGAMIDRVGLMLAYDAEGAAGWPRDTAYVGFVASSGPLRWALRGAQRLAFHTWLVWLLVLVGTAGLVASGRWRTAVLLAAVPVHHCVVQSFLLTEYKYTLPVHAWMFLLAGSAALWLERRKAKDVERTEASDGT